MKFTYILIFFFLLLYSCKQNNLYFYDIKGQEKCLHIYNNKPNTVIFLDFGYCGDCYKSLLSSLSSDSIFHLTNVFVVSKQSNNLAMRVFKEETLKQFPGEIHILYYNDNFYKSRISDSLELKRYSPCLLVLKNDDIILIGKYIDVFDYDQVKANFRTKLINVLKEKQG